MENILRQIEMRVNELSDNKFDFKVKWVNGELLFYSKDYFIYQDAGVRGTKRGSSDMGFKYKLKAPPASSFEKYTSNKGYQFAIAKSIQRDGIPAKHYTEKFENDDILEQLITDLILNIYL